MATATRQPGRGRASGRPGETADDTAVAERQGTARPSRRRVAAARGASAMGSGMLVIARLVRLATALAVLIIVAGILLRVLDANTSNAIVGYIHDAARWLTTPFHGMFSISKPKVSLAVNWGVAAVVYLIVGSLIARLIARAAPRPAVPATA